MSETQSTPLPVLSPKSRRYPKDFQQAAARLADSCTSFVDPRKLFYLSRWSNNWGPLHTSQQPNINTEYQPRQLVHPCLDNYCLWE